MRKFFNYYFLLILALISSTSIKATVTITKSSGWFESAYVEWAKEAGYSYNVYISPSSSDSWTKIDDELVREYSDYGRADAIGLAKGGYKLKVVPVKDNAEITADATETGTLNVENYDRGGFAHFKTASSTFNPSNGVGAYKNDGTLKDGAKVLYVTADNAKTITANVKTSSSGSTTQAVGFQNIIDLYQKGYDKTPIAFRIIGTVKAENMDGFSSSSEGLQIKGKNAYSELNITIEGVGFDATVHGFGFLLRNACSVELRNFAIMWFMDDAVSMDTDNSNLWIHNLDLFYGKPGSASDQKKGDGTLDIKGDSKYCTMSYNHLWDSGKASLCGMTSESGPNYITYHHNWFDHSDSRHARIRTMSVHLYNNYFDGNAKYGVGAAKSSDAFVENNYFRNCKYPMLISKQGSDVHNGVGSSDKTKGTFSGEEGGIIKAYGNEMTGQNSFEPWEESGTYNTHFDAYVVSNKSDKVPNTVKALLGGHVYNNFDTDASLMYTGYTCHAANQVVEVVTGELGAGRCNHGDFSWTFGPNEDTNYEVIASLSTAIQNYKSTLVGFFGKTISNGGGTTGGNTGGSDEGGGTSGGNTGGEGGGNTGDEGNALYKFTVKESVAAVDGNKSGEIATLGGTFVYGNVTKIDASSISASGYSCKLDGDASATNTKYVQANLTNALKAGDVISIKGYATSTPSASSPYGFIVYADQTSAGVATPIFSAKNKEEALKITVDEKLAGLNTIYVCRSTAKSVYFTAIEVTGITTGIDDIDISENKAGNMYDLQGRRISAPLKGQLYIMNGKKYIGK